MEVKITHYLYMIITKLLPKDITALMKEFHKKGTFWTYINNIIETPLFVDSSLTSMIQMADICSYAIRRYLENNETVLFDEIFKRAHRKGNTVVGVRHFSNPVCTCKICQSHKYISTGVGMVSL